MIKNTILFFSSIGRTTKPITKKKESTKKGGGQRVMIPVQPFYPFSGMKM